MTGIEKIAPYHVLIVDDVDLSTDFGPMTKLLLESLGCIAKQVKTVDEAICEIESSYYDILVIDINLGSGKDSNGFTLQKAIRASGKVQPIKLANYLLVSLHW